MQSSFIHSSLLFLLFSCFMSPHLRGHERDVWVYLPGVQYFESETQSLTLQVSMESREVSVTKKLNDQSHWYHFSYQSMGFQPHHFQLIYDGKTVEDEFPSGVEDVFIGFKGLKYFPLTAEIWTKEDIFNKLSIRSTIIEGEFDIPVNQRFSIPEKAYLHQPFNYLPNQPENWGTETPIQPREDWKSARFEFQIDLPNTSLVFLQLNNRYHPVVIRPYERIELPMSLVKSQLADVSSFDNSVLGGPAEIRLLLGLKEKEIFKLGVDEKYNAVGIAQQFFNDRYPYGLSVDQYRRLVSTLRIDSNSLFNSVSNSRRDTLMAWAHAIAPFFEQADESPDEILHMINQLGRESWKEAFIETFNQKIHRDEYQMDEKRNKWEEKFIFFFFIFFVLFVLAVIGRLINPRNLVSQHLNKFELMFHLSFWALLTFTLSVETRDGIWMVTNPINMLFLWSVGLLFYANALYVVPKFLAKRKWKLFFWSIAGIVLAFAFTFMLMSLNPLRDFYWIWVNGDWHGYYKSNQILEEHLAPFFAIGLVVAPVYGLLRNLLVNRLPQLQQQKGRLTAELKALKTQISPHFFFNSLNTVYSYALGEDSPKTAEAITKLSDMMRFVIYHGDKTKVELTKELEYLEDYIELQKLRLNPKKHDIRFRINGEPQDLQIAPLILITPIENAFKHGISMSHDSYIYIDLLIQHHGLILTVENSVHEGQLIPVSGKTLTEEESGVGIQNTRQRLDLLYTGLYEWHTEEGSDRYFTQLSLDLI